jgi:hypothetical protein
MKRYRGLEQNSLGEFSMYAGSHGPYKEDTRRIYNFHMSWKPLSCSISGFYG